jgi:hypothetical protein
MASISSVRVGQQFSVGYRHRGTGQAIPSQTLVTRLTNGVAAARAA